MVSMDILVDQSPLAKLRPETKQSIVHLAQMMTAPAGTIRYSQGEPPTGLFALQEGRVKLYRQSSERAQILAIPLPGECFGAESLATGESSPCTAAALTNVSAVYVPPNALRALLPDHADLQELLLEVAADRLRQLVLLVHDLAFRDVTSRLAAILAARAKAEGCATELGISLDRLLSQQEFAAMAGSAREVICRIFKKFENDGLLRLTRHNITILDLDGLLQLARREAR
jgi:CRP/FNR family transcriptional regulator